VQILWRPHNPGVYPLSGSDPATPTIL
jgi:hypothetical protein